MKADRLLSALLLLQGHGQLSERELAERLEVSQRTAHRDMEALCAAGIPLIAHRGAQGGWRLEKGWRTRVPGLDEAELQALLMAQPSALGDRRLSAAAQRAFDKLMASMPAALRSQAESIRARLHVDPTGWRPVVEDLSALPIVQDAVARDCRLTFAYTRADGRTRHRTVDPLGLVSKQTAWYLVARSAGAIKTYRIGRMKNAVVLAVSFERPRRFNLEKTWKRSTEALRDAQRIFRAVLVLSPAGAHALREWVPMHETSGPALRDGWKTWEVEFDSDYSARFVALGLGSQARVVQPDELRRQVSREVAKMANPHTPDN